MDSLGINTGLLIAQLLPIIMFIVIPVISLLDLRKKNLNGLTLGIWVLVICAIPIIGALAYWIVRPSAEIK